MAITKQSYEKGNLMSHSNRVSTNLHITESTVCEMTITNKVIISNFVSTPDILAEYGTYTMYTVSTGYKVLKKQTYKQTNNSKCSKTLILHFCGEHSKKA